MAKYAGIVPTWKVIPRYVDIIKSNEIEVGVRGTLEISSILQPMPFYIIDAIHIIDAIEDVFSFLRIFLNIVAQHKMYLRLDTESSTDWTSTRTIKTR
jgi:hypothetical protein